MTDSIYAPPTAKLNAEPVASPAFYTVSPTKLIIMLWATSGLYGVYWFYKNWALYKDHSGRSIWLIPRAWFGVLFLPSLLCKLDRALKEQGKSGMPYWVGTAALYISFALLPLAISFFFGLVQGLAGMSYDPPGIYKTLALSSVVLVVEGLILLRVQTFINVLNDDPSGSTNAKFSNGNWLWIAIGLLYWFAGYLLNVAMIPNSV